MGGDYAPGVVVQGAIDALNRADSRFRVTLVGRPDAVEAECARLKTAADPLRESGALSVHPASEVIEMHDHPNAALRAKRDSSITVGLNLHRDGKADAFVSAGNTGAVLSASTLILGRVKGVGRPTIGALIPTTTGVPSLLVDAGTNVDCKPRHLYEFGVMGSIYVSSILQKEKPSVALLSIGEEDTKGNEASLLAFEMFKKSSLNFIGNVEGRDVLKGKADVVVCDGFVGNILLKFGESVPSFFKAKFTAFAEKGLKNKLVALVARGGLRSVMKELDYQEHGGVPLLGVNGVSIIGHGGSTPRAIMNMIIRAEEIALRRVNDQIAKALELSTDGAA
jgi:glycerol-3-phosphate acyltransferase PlsX